MLVLCRSADRVGYKEWTATLDTAYVDEDSTFSFTWTADAPDFYQLCGRRGFPVFPDLWLEPGDTLSVTTLADDHPSGRAYTGAHAGAYAFYDVLDSVRAHDKEFTLGYREVCTLAQDSVRTLLQSRMEKESALVNQHFKGHPDWKPIARHIEDQRRFEVLDLYFRYLYYYNYCVNDTFVYLLPDSSYYDFLTNIDLTTAPRYYNYGFNQFLQSYLEDRMHHDYAQMPDSVFWENRLSYLFAVAVKYLEGEVRDAAMLTIAQEFSFMLEYENFFDEMAGMRSWFAENHTSAQLLDAFTFICDQYETLRPGSPMPDMALPDINGDTVRLSGLRGKVLYIDFWGTWCYPCLQEFPYSLELHEQFSNEPVEFVFIGLQGGGDQVEEWKQFVRGERSLSWASFLEQQVYPGVQLLAEGQFHNPELKPYRISSAPTYMLVDAEGRIVRARAPRPSDPETEGMLREVIRGVRG
jgi:thiol-disulfide isomerase/thioredoxin